MLSFAMLSVLLLEVASKSFSHDLPAYFPSCHLDDPDLNVCISKAANALRPYIRKGIKEIDFPSFEPLVISNFGLLQESQLVNYTTKVRNYTIAGLDNYNFKEILYDPKTMSFRGKVEFAPVLCTTAYEIEGMLLSIPINGQGLARATLGPINATFEVNGEIVIRKGIEYYNPTSTKIRATFADGSYYFDGLFGGNTDLARTTNNMLNENSKMLVDAITPALEKLSEIGLMKLMKHLTRAVPYYKLFPKSQ